MWLCLCSIILIFDFHLPPPPSLIPPLNTEDLCFINSLSFPFTNGARRDSRDRRQKLSYFIHNKKQWFFYSANGFAWIVILSILISARGLFFFPTGTLSMASKVSKPSMTLQWQHQGEEMRIMKDLLPKDWVLVIQMWLGRICDEELRSRSICSVICHRQYPTSVMSTAGERWRRRWRLQHTCAQERIRHVMDDPICFLHPFQCQLGHLLES